MSSSIKVREGQWYSDRANHDFFCVIAVDESDGYIDVRDRYGDIDEFDFDEWEAMELELCAAPEDWQLFSEEADDEGDGLSDPAVMQQPAGPAHQRKSSGTT